MIPRLYLGGGSVLLAALAWSSWNGWEFTSANRGMPTPGLAMAAMMRAGSASSGRTGSGWYSSGSRSGASVFGGK